MFTKIGFPNVRSYVSSAEKASDNPTQQQQ